ncbi:MAG: LPS export ABC transporter periplasmic protein LptC [Pararhizobium sp.]
MSTAEAIDRRVRAPGRSHVEYRKALRHSFLVRVLKFSLPMIAVLVLAGFFGASILNAALPSGIKVDSTMIEGGKLVMKNPVLTGQNPDGELYKLVAKRATQEIRNPNIISLQGITATLPVGGGTKATINAESAVYNRDTQVITFDKPFQVKTTSGMVAELKSARFDAKAGQLVSSKPIDVKTPEGALVAHSLRMRDNGKVLEFKDRVRMTVQPSTIKPKNEDKAN